MITLKAVVRKPRTDGFFSVYIRIVHNRKPGYIKTNKIIDAAHIDSNGELTDPVVNEYCSMIIRQYTDRLNRTDISLWDVKDVLEYLQKTDEEVCLASMPNRSFTKWKRKVGKEPPRTTNLPWRILNAS